MKIKKFESYSEDEEILKDIFSPLEDENDISISVEKTFLVTDSNPHIGAYGTGKPTFGDIFNHEDDDPFFRNVSKLLPDSDIIVLRRYSSVPYGLRNVPFYIIRMDFDRDLFINSDPKKFSEMASEYGFLQVYDSRSKFGRGDKIKRILVFYHENYIGH